MVPERTPPAASVQKQSPAQGAWAGADQVFRIAEVAEAIALQSFEPMIRTLIATVGARDMLTERHSLRVARYGRQIARYMGLGATEVFHIERAALLHDIGKIGVPDSILNKPGPLLDCERAIVRRHPQMGVDILHHATELEDELPIVLHHHERFDGRGYPHGLAGNRIPLGARILNLADSLDAMLSYRPYKASMPLHRARAELLHCSGHQFDPEVVDAALGWLDAREAKRGRRHDITRS